MNLMQKLLSSLFAQPTAEEMVLKFVASSLQTDDALLLVTDPAMQPMYKTLACRLRCSVDGEMPNICSDLEHVIGKEVIVVHSTLEPAMLRAIALRAKRMLLVVEYYDHNLAVGLVDELAATCEVELSYLEDGVGERCVYSPTESHYLGHRVRRIVKAELK